MVGPQPFLNADGSAPLSTNFTDFFFTITGFHGLHVTSGVVLNIIVLANVIERNLRSTAATTKWWRK